MKHFKKAFIVDDDDILNFVTTALLAKFDPGCQVTSFTNPENAFDSLISMHESGEDLPDVLLLDINMPKLNGFDFLQKMKVGGFSRKIQVIMYTSSGNPEDKKRSSQFDNVVGYMEKPFSAQAYGKILEMSYSK